MSADPLFAALVLAGSRPGGGDPVAQITGVSHKCMAPVAGRPMVERVLAVLAASPRIAEIGLIADLDCSVASLPSVVPLLASGRLTIIPQARTPATSVLAALEVVDRRPILITTADHALLDDRILREFMTGAMAGDADVAAGLARGEVILAAYPDTKRTFWRFRDGRFSGANLFALMTPEGAAAVRFWRLVEAERKRPWRIARVFGFGSLLLYVSGMLTLDRAFARASVAIGARARAVPISIAEAAIDVDKPADLELVERILRARGEAA